jgi:hypothetical protein
MVKEIVSLLDPSTHKRIQVATRGVACTHAQCFDRDTYLTDNLTCNATCMLAEAIGLCEEKLFFLPF